MPVLVLLIGRAMNTMLVLLFWPGSIAILSLGAEEKPLNYVFFVWSVAVGLNIILYLIVGLVVYLALKFVRG